ncbi:MAG: hypothetical protein KDC38_06170 [Planctomycetes bacterium]|nr:hypothetical protein [Planctomycetota bacterium]
MARACSCASLMALIIIFSGRAPAQNDFRRGDIDGNGVVHPVFDEHAWKVATFEGYDTLPCQKAADTNDDGILNFMDDGKVFNWWNQLLLTPVPDPGPFVCGPDPTPDSLTCDTYVCTATPGVYPTSSQYLLFIEDAAAPVGSIVNVDVWLQNDASGVVDGWSFGVCHDPTALELLTVSLGPDTPIFGLGIPYFDLEHIEPGVGWVAHIFGTFSYGLGFLTTGTHHIYTARYRVLTEGVSTVDFCTTVPDGAGLTESPLGVVHRYLPPVTPLTMSAEITGSTPPAENDDCIDAAVVLEGSLPFTLATATDDGPSLAGSCDIAGSGLVHRDVWFCHAADCTGEITISTAGSGFDTRLAVYDGCGCPVSAGDLVDCNDDDPLLSNGESSVTVPVLEGQLLLIEVGTAAAGILDNFGTLTLTCDGATQGEFLFEQKLLGSDITAGEVYGNAFDIDGDVAVVGAVTDDGIGPDTGTAYIYRKIGGQWMEEQRLFSATGAEFNGFGRSVAVSGNRIVVAEPGIDDPITFAVSGKVYEYLYDGSSWELETVFDGPGRFGSYLELEDDRLVISTAMQVAGFGGTMVIYRYDGSGWFEEYSYTSTGAWDFGHTMELHGDRLIVGSGDLNAEGDATIFEFDGATWLPRILTASDGFVANLFGLEVAIDGDRAAVSAPFDDAQCPGSPDCLSGAVYCFERQGGTWVETQKFIGDLPQRAFGTGLAMRGTQMLVGVTGGRTENRGQIDVYEWTGSTWTYDRTIVAPDSDPNDGFGIEIDMDGSTAFVRASGDDDTGLDTGAVYVFDCDCGVPIAFVRGDINGDTAVDIGDAVGLLSALFDASSPPLACLEGADGNDDGLVNVADAIYVLSYLFSMGSPPTAPFPTCGFDPELITLGCASASCP